jgi:hypothetical protein
LGCYSRETIDSRHYNFHWLFNQINE